MGRNIPKLTTNQKIEAELWRIKKTKRKTFRGFFAMFQRRTLKKLKKENDGRTKKD